MIPERLADALDHARDRSKEDALYPQPAPEYPEDELERARMTPTTKDPMTTLTEIPVVAQQAIDLLRLLDAVPIARPYTVTIHERHTPGAAATLRAWAEANGFATHEDHYPSTNGYPAYANLTATISEHGTRIVVLAYRDLSPEEIATEIAKRTPESAVGL